MKKMLIGLGLLAVLFIAVTVNSMQLENLLSGIQEEIKTSYSLSGFDASEIIKSSFDKWQSIGKYTKAILSNSEYEMVSESYFECISNPDDNTLKDKLIYELEQLIESEKISFVSIL